MAVRSEKTPSTDAYTQKKYPMKVETCAFRGIAKGLVTNYS